MDRRASSKLTGEAGEVGDPDPDLEHLAALEDLEVLVSPL
jgi:hypothetical protein